jgi:hypothetical protein
MTSTKIKIEVSITNTQSEIPIKRGDIYPYQLALYFLLKCTFS